MKGVPTNTTNRHRAGKGFCAETYPGEKSVPLPARGKGGFSKGTAHRMNKVEAVPGNAHQGLSESGTESD